MLKLTLHLLIDIAGVLFLTLLMWNMVTFVMNHSHCEKHGSNIHCFLDADLLGAL